MQKKDIYDYFLTEEELDELCNILQYEEYWNVQANKIQDLIGKIEDRWYNKGYKDGYENCIKDSTNYE